MALVHLDMRDWKPPIRVHTSAGATFKNWRWFTWFGQESQRIPPSPALGDISEHRARIPPMTMCAFLLDEQVRLQRRTGLGEVFVILGRRPRRNQKHPIRRNLIKIKLVWSLEVRDHDHTYLERTKALPDGHGPN